MAEDEGRRFSAQAIQWLQQDPHQQAQQDLVIFEARRSELAAAVARADQIRAGCNLDPYRLLLPNWWGLSFAGGHAKVYGMDCEIAGVATPLLVYAP